MDALDSPYLFPISAINGFLREELPERDKELINLLLHSSSEETIEILSNIFIFKKNIIGKFTEYYIRVLLLARGFSCKMVDKYCGLSGKLCAMVICLRDNPEEIEAYAKLVRVPPIINVNLLFACDAFNFTRYILFNNIPDVFPENKEISSPIIPSFRMKLLLYCNGYRYIYNPCSNVLHPQVGTIIIPDKV